MRRIALPSVRRTLTNGFRCFVASAETDLINVTWSE